MHINAVNWLGAGLVWGLLAGLAAKFSLDGFNAFVGLLTSVGTFLAAGATYLTVREMKAGRVANARGRVAVLGQSKAVAFDWCLGSLNKVRRGESVALLVRNASQGIARGIRANWKIKNALHKDEFDSLMAYLPPGKSISLINNGYAIEFINNDMHSDLLAVNGNTFTYLGDLGQTQEITYIIPEAVENYAFIKCLSALLVLFSNGAINTDNLPLFILSFSHNSPYGEVVEDSHLVRFSIVEHQFFKRGRVVRSRGIPNDWDQLRLALKPEFTSYEIDSLTRVVVG